VTNPEDDPVAPRRAVDGLDRPGSPVTDPQTGARVIRVGAMLDATVGPQLRREVRVLLARSPDPLVVDLTALREAEPVGGSAVLRDLAHEAGAADVDLRVVLGSDPSEVARAVLDEALFEIYPTVEAALEHLAAPQQDLHRGHPFAGGR
jgi:hypothetical protein